MSKVLLSTVFAVSLILMGCGGGEKDSSSGSIGSNSAPVLASANADFSVEVGSELNYDTSQGGSTFSDPDGDTLELTVEISPPGSSLTVSGTRITGVADTAGQFEVIVTATDPDGRSVVDRFTITVEPEPAVEVFGMLQYERIPVTTSGFDTSSMRLYPMRGLNVELRNELGELVSKVKSTEAGYYQFDLRPNTNYFIRVAAQLYFEDGEEAPVEVLDNTNSNALYVIESSTFNSAEGLTTLNLTARSGWADGGYTQERSAAPFAMLDNVYTAMQALYEVDPEADLSALNIYWSELNNPSSGSVTDGDLGSSFYTSNGLYILGKEDVDTDEFDTAVIYHEWVHFLQDDYGRSDNIGGRHGYVDKLDMRVAYAEGEATAVGGMISGDEYYLDVSGEGQSFIGGFSLEDASSTVEGWYGEDSVVEILWDAYDSPSMDDDNVALSFAEIMSLFRASRDTDSFNSIFVFGENILASHPEITSELEALFSAEDINPNGLNDFAVGATNDGGSPYVLPVYRDLSTVESAYVCMSDEFGTYNKLLNWHFLRVNIDVAATYTISMTRDYGPSGSHDSDPDMWLYQGGELLGVGRSGDIDSESFDVDLMPGVYTMAAQEWNFEDGVEPRDSLTCYTIDIVAK